MFLSSVIGWPRATFELEGRSVLYHALPTDDHHLETSFEDPHDRQVNCTSALVSSVGCWLEWLDQKQITKEDTVELELIMLKLTFLRFSLSALVPQPAPSMGVSNQYTSASYVAGLESCEHRYT